MNVAWRYKNNHGMSIVEILVVMVVLLVGIMSVVSMFPGGFRAVRHAESVTFADRLAQAELEKWKNSAQNLPAGVVAIDPATYVVNNDQNPCPPIDDAKAMNIRRIVGETTKVPVGAPYQQDPTDPGKIEYASMYTVAYAPIEYSSTRQDDLVITSANLRRREMESDDSDAPYHIRASEYGIDYGSAQGSSFKVCFKPQNQNALYYLTFSYWVQTSNGMELRSKVDMPVNVPAGNDDWVTVSLADIDTANGETLDGIEDSSDTAARGFIEIANNVTWDPADVYEYRLVDPSIGIIAFNPYGHDTLENTSRGMVPLEARISYNVYDLTIIHEDRRVGDDGRVKLSLKYIMQHGQPVEDPLPGRSNTYQGLPGYPNGGLKDIIAIDLATGIKLALNDPNAGQQVKIDYENGSLTFDPYYKIPISATGESLPLVGRNIRILYRAEGDWSLQLQKAYELYRRDVGTTYGTNTPRSVDFRTYNAGTTQDAQGNSILNGKLWFAPCDAGKTIAIDYSYVDGSGLEHRIVGECHQIPEASQTLPGGSGIDACPIDLDYKSTRKYGTDAGNNQMTRIYSVVGVSLKVRVLWREGKRWLYIDKDTALTRKPDEA